MNLYNVRVVFIFFACLLMWTCANPSINPFLQGFQITGFEPDGPLMVYNQETLFQYMNGEAEVYISHGFKFLYVQAYMNSETGALILVESYDMGTAQGAEKIYSEYAGEQGTRLDELGEAAWTDNFLILFKRNRFFFRVMPDTAYDNEAAPTIHEMVELSKTLAKQLRIINLIR